MCPKLALDMAQSTIPNDSKVQTWPTGPEQTKIMFFHKIKPHFEHNRSQYERDQLVSRRVLYLVDKNLQLLNENSVPP